jgi:hypothetical protein
MGKRVPLGKVSGGIKVANAVGTNHSNRQAMNKKPLRDLMHELFFVHNPLFLRSPKFDLKNNNPI